MAKLTYKQRKKMAPKSFVFPKDKRYPIPDVAHGRNALARVAQHGTSTEKAAVRRKVKAKFPSIGKGIKTTRKGSQRLDTYES